MNPPFPYTHRDDESHQDQPRLPAAGPALRLTVYVSENAQFRHRPISTEIVHRARRADLAGASVFRGVEGFGSSATVHTTRLLALVDDLPIAVVVVDEEERVRAFLPELRQVIPEGEGLVTLDRVEVVGEENGTGPDTSAR